MKTNPSLTGKTMADLHKDEPPTDEEDPLEDYPTEDILHDYRMLLPDFGPDDDLVKEMRAILVSRHRYLSNAEMAGAPQEWENARVDTAKYIQSVTLAFEVDKHLFEYWKNAGEMVQAVYHTAPRAGGTSPQFDIPQHLVGFYLESADGILPPDIGPLKAMEIIEAILYGTP